MDYFNDNKDLETMIEGHMIGETIGVGLSLFRMIDTGYHGPWSSRISRAVSIYCAFCLAFGERGMSIKEKIIFGGILGLANLPMGIKRFRKFRYKIIERLPIKYETPAISISSTDSKMYEMDLKYKNNVIGIVRVDLFSHAIVYTIFEKVGDDFKVIKNEKTNEFLTVIGFRKNYHLDIKTAVHKFKKHVRRNRRDLLK